MQHSKPKSRFVRVLLWVSILGGLIALLAFAFGVGVTLTREASSSPGSDSAQNISTVAVPTSAANTSEVSTGRDYSTTHLSDNGLYRVSYVASTGVIPINQMHRWTLHVETTDGQPVENATITVDGDMPEHGHGLPTRPQMTEYLGNGDYLIEGLKFQMGGWWVMDFVITANNQSDTVQFNLLLP